MSITAGAQSDLWAQAQLCCSVLDSIGGAESYSVSVSWVGSPANVQGFDSVPAPQSQKNLQKEEKLFLDELCYSAKKKTRYYKHISLITVSTHHSSDPSKSLRCLNLHLVLKCDLYPDIPLRKPHVQNVFRSAWPHLEDWLMCLDLW